jgi:hypothetical protein
MYKRNIMNRGKQIKVRDDNTEYIVYHPYPCTQLPPLNQPPAEGLVTTSIDIAIKNFAIRIETIYPDGRITPIYFNRIDFTTIGVDASDSSGTAVVDPRILTTSTAFIYSIFHLIKMSRLVAIERQMAINVKSSRMFQHILTLLMVFVPQFTYPDVVIMDVSPKVKGKYLDFGKGLTYNQTKERSIEIALELLQIRGDTWSIGVINNNRGRTKTKADDLADTVNQMEALRILLGGIVTQKRF